MYEIVVEASIATGRRWTIVAPRFRMKKIGLILLAGFLVFSAPSQLHPQSDDPSEVFLKAYMTSQQGEKLEHDNQFKAALAKYRFAGSLLEDLRKNTGSALDLARECSSWPLAALIYTDISKDGMLDGPNVEATAELAAAVAPLPVIASGGVTSLQDVARLARCRLAGCIIGRALYEGRLSLAEVLQKVRGQRSEKTSDL